MAGGLFEGTTATGTAGAAGGSTEAHTMQLYSDNFTADPEQVNKNKISLGVMYLFLGVDVFLAIAILVTNTVVVYMILRIRSLRTTENRHVLSLSCANYLAALFAITGSIFTHFASDDHGTFCKMYQYCIHVADTAEVYSIMAIAYDRSTSVLKTDGGSSAKVVTKRLIILAWVFSVIYSARAPRLNETHPTFYRDGEQMVSLNECGPIVYGDHRLVVISKVFVAVDFVVLLCFPVLFIGICYVRVIRGLKINASALQAISIKRRRRVVKTVVLLLIVFLVCEIPHQVMRMFVYLGTAQFTDRLLLAELTVEVIAFTKFALNPIIYALRNQQFRLVLAKHLPCCRRRGHCQVSPAPNTLVVPATTVHRRETSNTLDAVATVTLVVPSTSQVGYTTTLTKSTVISSYHSKSNNNDKLSLQVPS